MGTRFRLRVLQSSGRFAFDGATRTVNPPHATRLNTGAYIMAKSTRKIVAKPAATATVATVTKAAAKPVAVAATVAKPAAVPAVIAVPAVAKPSANITRTAATVVAQRTNFGTLSDRDTAYLGFYRRHAATQTGGIATLASIVASGLRPAHLGSNKPHDAGVINRLAKAGLIAASADGHSFTITALGTSTKA
jgi:hypothetical protein